MSQPADRFLEMLERLARLRVDMSTGDPAPHKPLLLLVALELAERGELQPVLDLTPQLAFRFCSYFSIVAHRRGTRPDIRLPFHHLVSDGVWTPMTADGTASEHRSSTRKAALSERFIDLANDAGGREFARRLLIAKYFRPTERAALYTLVGMPVPAEDQIQADAEIGRSDEAQQIGRDARFRIEVVSAYDYTCCLTGHRLLTIDVGSIVDAAHIHPFCDSRNNDLRNGIALCKNAHWAFDEGLWTVGEESRILVAKDCFAESCPDGRKLADYHGHALRLPSNQEHRPDPRHFAWHLKYRFRGAAGSG